MEGAAGGLGYGEDDPQNPPPYSPPDLGTPIWHRVMADLVDLREMVELAVANAQNVLADANTERPVLIGNKLALERALADVATFKERLNDAEITDSNRDAYRDVRRLLT